MKAGWQKKSLGEVLRLEYGKPLEPADRDPNGLYPAYGANGEKNRTDKFYWDRPSIIVGRKGSAGEITLTEERFWPLDVTYFVDFDQQCYDLRFLYYLLVTLDLPSLAKGVKPGINRNEVYALPVKVPRLPEQQRIVGILDVAFDGIAPAKANAEKNLQNARVLFESHLQSVFTQHGEGWVEKPLGDVCDLLNGFAFKSGDVVPESETQLVRMGNLYGNKLDLDRSPVFYPDRFAVNYQRYILNEGDLIMSLTGTTGKEDYGYAVRIPECKHGLLMNQRIVKFDSIKESFVNWDYLLHYLRSRVFLDVLYPTANGTRQANLSSVTIKTLPIPLCSIREQKRIASSLESLSDETQRLESIYQQKLAALDELKKSLLHQAFSGEL